MSQEIREFWENLKAEMIDSLMPSFHFKIKILSMLVKNY